MALGENIYTISHPGFNSLLRRGHHLGWESSSKAGLPAGARVPHPGTKIGQHWKLRLQLQVHSTYWPVEDCPACLLEPGGNPFAMLDWFEFFSPFSFGMFRMPSSWTWTTAFYDFIRIDHFLLTSHRTKWPPLRRHNCWLNWFMMARYEYAKGSVITGWSGWHQPGRIRW